jgi:hypothetical protein
MDDLEIAGNGGRARICMEVIGAVLEKMEKRTMDAMLADVAGGKINNLLILKLAAFREIKDDLMRVIKMGISAGEKLMGDQI